MGAIEGQNRLPKDAVGSFVTRPGNRMVAYVMFAYKKAVLVCYRPKFMASISGSRARRHSLRGKSAILESSSTGAILPENSYGWANKAPQGGSIPKSTRTKFRNSIMLRVMGQRKLRDLQPRLLIRMVPTRHSKRSGHDARTFLR